MATGLNRSRAFLVVVCFAAATLLLVVGGTAQQGIHTIPADEVQLLDPPPASPRGTDDLDCSDDCGDSDDSGSAWGYVCELGSYQAWFGFDVSSIPDGEDITALSFTVLMENYNSQEVERSLWYDAGDSWIDGSGCPGTGPADELVGTIMHGADAVQWETFDVDLSGHDWQIDLNDDRVTLMVSGPTNGEHFCGIVYFMESESMPFITVVTGTPTPTLPAFGMALLMLALAGAAFLVLRR